MAVADPSDLQSIDGLRLVLQRTVQLGVADQSELEFVIRRVHRGDIELDEAEDSLFQESQEREEILHTATSAPAVKAVNNALGRCIDEGASDIHFATEQDGMVVRARVDGVMREVMRIPKRLQNGVISA